MDRSWAPGSRWKSPSIDPAEFHHYGNTNVSLRDRTKFSKDENNGIVGQVKSPLGRGGVTKVALYLFNLMQMGAVQSVTLFVVFCYQVSGVGLLISNKMINCSSYYKRHFLSYFTSTGRLPAPNA